VRPSWSSIAASIVCMVAWWSWHVSLEGGWRDVDGKACHAMITGVALEAGALLEVSPVRKADRGGHLYTQTAGARIAAGGLLRFVWRGCKWMLASKC